MSSETTTELEINVKKRGGQVVAFNETRISKAIENAFKEFRKLPREVELSIESSRDAQKVALCVLSVLKERALNKDHITVEEVQDEVIRQIYENGFKDVGELYANYRKQHSARRLLFELYNTVKRDGKTVSFKPEKITSAIAKAFRANNNHILTEILLGKVHEISDEVISEIRKLWPDGKSIEIEEIQDLVERCLMKNGFHTVARTFIVYREERSKIRREKQRLEVSDDSFDWAKNIFYETKVGEEKPLNLKEIRFLIESCCIGLENVSSEEVLKESVKNYFHGITEDKIALSNIMAAKSFIEREPNYSYVAARLLLLKQYNEAIGRNVSFDGVKTEYSLYFASYIRKAVELELLSPDLLSFDLKILGNCLKPRRDFKFKYLGIQTLYDRYFIHSEEVRLELPQVFWMRVAMGLAKREKSQKNQKAIEFYNILSTFRFMSSTPTLFNSGTRHSQLSSCFLTTIDDDLHHIFKCVQDDAMMSKW